MPHLRERVTPGRDISEDLPEPYALGREPAVRRRLVARYLPLARFAASRYSTGSEPFGDLLQVASIGLLNAIDRFDPDNGVHGELRRHFRDRSWPVRPPRDLQETALRVARTTDDLERSQRRSPTAEEVAADAGLTVAGVLEAREALAARHASSLSASIEPDDEHARAEEREMVRLRFEDDLTQAQIGAIVGLSQMHVSRVLRDALAKLQSVAAATPVAC